MIGSALGYACFALACIILFSKILIHGYVPSESMVPTLEVGEHLLINGLSYTFGDVERGDIVVFYSEELEETLVKRCIGLPGDEIRFEAGEVYINGELYEEDYLREGVETYSYRSFTVPEDSYFFLGDNRTVSNDARYWDDPYIPKDQLIGKVIWHFNPGK